MHKGGPKHKPLKLRMLEGKRSHRPLPEELEPPEGDILKPDHLDLYAAEEWDRISWGLKAMGILAQIDQAALGAYCAAYGRWRAAEEELNKLAKSKGGVLSSLIIQTAQGNYIQQPLIGIANKAAGDMVRYATEFGMTPSARARLAISPTQGKSKFSGLIKIVGGKG